MKIFLIILICIATIGCQKEHVELDSCCSTGIHYLKFESLEAFYDTVEYLQANNEIVEYASRNGFNSFYDKSHEIYNKLRNMSYESQNEIIAAFKEHQRFVDIADNDGELEAIEKLSSSFYKYFINEDQIVQVGEQLFKVLENNIVKTDLHNYNLLLSINDRDIQDLYKYSTTSRFHFSPFFFKAQDSKIDTYLKGLIGGQTVKVLQEISSPYINTEVDYGLYLGIRYNPIWLIGIYGEIGVGRFTYSQLGLSLRF